MGAHHPDDRWDRHGVVGCRRTQVVEPAEQRARHQRRSQREVIATTVDRGSAAVDFVLVGSLVTFLFLAVVQLGIDYHVRNVLAACVAEGARYGANADVADPEAGAAKANALITEA